MTEITWKVLTDEERKALAATIPQEQKDAVKEGISIKDFAERFGQEAFNTWMKSKH